MRTLSIHEFRTLVGLLPYGLAIVLTAAFWNVPMSWWQSVLLVMLCGGFYAGGIVYGIAIALARELDKEGK